MAAFPFRCAMAVLVAWLMAASPAWAAATIVWRLENPFRLFSDPVYTELHARVFASLTPQERKSPIVASERRLARQFPGGWAKSVFAHTCWRGEANRYTGCSERGSYMLPRQHRVVLRLEGLALQDRNRHCRWRLTSAARAAPPARGARDDTRIAPCTKPVRFAVPYPDGAWVSVEAGGKPLARQRVKVRDILIVGLGDSFASGEGNPDVPVAFSRTRAASYGVPPKSVALEGYPARLGAWSEIGDDVFLANGPRWWARACHRSLYGHQLRAALQLALEDPHRAVTFAGFACAGAEITDGLFLVYRGNEWVPNPPDLPQISAAAVAQCGGRSAPMRIYPHAYHLKGRLPELADIVLANCPRKRARKIDLLLLSIGGNDVGFSRIVANAVLADHSMLRKLGGWIGEVQDGSQTGGLVARLALRYKALNRALHNILHIPWREADRIVLTAYPVLALLEDGRSVCPDGRAGLDVFPEFALSEAKARDGETVSNRLHAAMRAAARRYGWSFASAHRTAFAGHGICAGSRDGSGPLADELRMPRLVNGRWRPYNPADYAPYAPRRRWFRTPNDAFLTGNFHVAGTVVKRALRLKRLSWFQLLLASTYSGAFHPTAEGQAVIADAILPVARRVLAKYARRERR